MTEFSKTNGKFIDFLLRNGALKFGDFTTKSGRQSPYFINTGSLCTGSQLEKLGEFYAAAILENFGDEVTNLFGPAYKGIPLATTAAVALNRSCQKNVSVTYDRKEAKDHGEKGWLMGHDYRQSESPDRVIIIEDVITAGTSVRECVPKIKEGLGAGRIIGLVVGVDRMEKGSRSQSALHEIEDSFGIKAVSLANFLQLVKYLEKEGETRGVNPSVLTKMLEYRRQYTAA